MVSGLIFNPPRVCRPWCEGFRTSFCHGSGTRHSSHDVELSSRAHVAYHTPRSESASLADEESVTIQPRSVRGATGQMPSFGGNQPAGTHA